MPCYVPFPYVFSGIINPLCTAKSHGRCVPVNDVSLNDMSLNDVSLNDVSLNDVSRTWWLYLCSRVSTVHQARQQKKCSLFCSLWAVSGHIIQGYFVPHGKYHTRDTYEYDSWKKEGDEIYVERGPTVISTGNWESQFFSTKGDRQLKFTNLTKRRLWYSLTCGLKDEVHS